MSAEPGVIGDTISANQAAAQRAATELREIEQARAAGMFTDTAHGVYRIPAGANPADVSNAAVDLARASDKPVELRLEGQNGAEPKVVTVKVNPDPQALVRTNVTPEGRVEITGPDNAATRTEVANAVNEHARVGADDGVSRLSQTDAPPRTTLSQPIDADAAAQRTTAPSQPASSSASPAADQLRAQAQTLETQAQAVEQRDPQLAAALRQEAERNRTDADIAQAKVYEALGSDRVPGRLDQYADDPVNYGRFVAQSLRTDAERLNGLGELTRFPKPSYACAEWDRQATALENA